MTYDPVTGTGTIASRAADPPWDAHASALDDHLLGARLLGPLVPWKDAGGSTGLAGSSGSVHAVVAEALGQTLDGALHAALLDNARASLKRAANFACACRVCWTGGLPSPDGKCASGAVFAWDPQHEFRGLRHLLVWRRFGWESERLLAASAIGRVLGEPYIMEAKTGNQRAYGWPLLLLAESLGTPLGQAPEAQAGIVHLLDVLWNQHGADFVTLNKAAGADHGFLPVCSWQHAVLTRALGRLVRRNFPDLRTAWLYKVAMRGLDSMRQPGTFSWWKDWDPATGSHLDAATVYGGTSLWTACAYAESLDVLTAAAPDRRAYLLGFMEQCEQLDPKNKGYDAASHALLAALVNKPS